MKPKNGWIGLKIGIWGIWRSLIPNLKSSFDLTLIYLGEGGVKRKNGWIGLKICISRFWESLIPNLVLFFNFTPSEFKESRVNI